MHVLHDLAVRHQHSLVTIALSKARSTVYHPHQHVHCPHMIISCLPVQTAFMSEQLFTAKIMAWGTNGIQRIVQNKVKNCKKLPEV